MRTDICYCNSNPEYFFSITCKDGFVNQYQNKLVEILEQIGRFGYLSVCFSYFYFLIKASG